MATLLAPAAWRLRLTADTLLLFVGWALGTFVLCMLTWLLVPTIVAGWQPMVVTSGSMAPTIDVGDVVLIDTTLDDPGVGSVVAFDHGDGPIIHRVVEAHPDMWLSTRGDANELADSSRVGPDDLIGTGRLLVPFIGWIRLLPPAALVVAFGIAGMAALSRRRAPARHWVATALTVFALTLTLSGAAFAASTSAPDNSIAALTVQPASGLVATCGLITATDASVDLDWTASPGAGITGYSIMHQGPSSGGYTEVATVSSGTTSYTHQLETVPLNIGSHSYQVWALSGSWRSATAPSDSVSLIESVDAYICLDL